uniref:CSON010452 protein n=1 Tax=Culicoides sonorensis TaxID=179676 RepID=A0A336M5P8_CULSO
MIAKLLISLAVLFISIISLSKGFDVGFGVSEKGEELLWVKYEIEPIKPERRNITHTFEFDGKTRNVNNITFVTFAYEENASATSAMLNTTLPSFRFVSAIIECTNCTFFAVTQRIYGFYNKNI